MPRSARRPSSASGVRIVSSVDATRLSRESAVNSLASELNKGPRDSLLWTLPETRTPLGQTLLPERVVCRVCALGLCSSCADPDHYGKTTAMVTGEELKTLTRLSMLFTPDQWADIQIFLMRKGGMVAANSKLEVVDTIDSGTLKAQLTTVCKNLKEHSESRRKKNIEIESTRTELMRHGIEAKFSSLKKLPQKNLENLRAKSSELGLPHMLEMKHNPASSSSSALPSGMTTPSGWGMPVSREALVRDLTVAFEAMQSVQETHQEKKKKGLAKSASTPSLTGGSASTQSPP